MVYIRGAVLGPKNTCVSACSKVNMPTTIFHVFAFAVLTLFFEVYGLNLTVFTRYESCVELTDVAWSKV